jgi:hypothetical protein
MARQMGLFCRKRGYAFGSAQVSQYYRNKSDFPDANSTLFELRILAEVRPRGGFGRCLATLDRKGRIPAFI